MGGPVVWLMDSVVVCLSKRLPIIDVNSKQNAHKPIYTVQTKTAVYHSVGLSFIDKDAFSIQAQSKSDSNNIYTVTYSINGTDWNSAIVSTDDHDKYERWKNTATQSKT